MATRREITRGALQAWGRILKRVVSRHQQAILSAMTLSGGRPNDADETIVVVRLPAAATR